MSGASEMTHKQNGPESAATDSQALANTRVSPSDSGYGHFNASRPALAQRHNRVGGKTTDLSNDKPVKSDGVPKVTTRQMTRR